MTAIVRFFRSVAGKVFGILTLCTLALILFNWVLNNVAFIDFYEREKETMLQTTFAEVCDAVEDGSDLREELISYTIDHDMTVIVWDSHRVLYSSERFDRPIALTNIPELNNGDYTIGNRSPLPGEGGNVMTLYGKSESGIQILLNLPISDIRESAAIANRFLWWAALGTLLLSCLLAFLLARVFTRPVRRLSAMAKRMADMDFSDRYEARGRDELAQLGESLNTVSETMQRSLSELKTANTRLQSDMEQAERQSDARHRFIRNVSHELKTPISLIQTYAEGLRENSASDPQLYCDVIEDEAQKLSQIIAKLTMLMQLESGGEELSIEQFDMTDLLNRLLARYAPLFAERSLSLPVLPDAPCFVWGDGLLVENVMINFLTNALHHVENGGEIRLDLHPTENGTVRIALFNTGDPIPEEDLPHLFESFYKVDKARTRAYGGTGIGLSVVAAIMQAHHMPYGVRNLENGVEFFIELQAQ